MKRVKRKNTIVEKKDGREKKDNRSVKTVDKEIQSASRQRQRDTATQAELLLNDHIAARRNTGAHHKWNDDCLQTAAARRSRAARCGSRIGRPGLGASAVAVWLR